MSGRSALGGVGDASVSSHQLAVAHLRRSFAGTIIVSTVPYPSMPGFEVWDIAQAASGMMIFSAISQFWTQEIGKLERVRLLELAVLRRKFSVAAGQFGRHAGMRQVEPARGQAMEVVALEQDAWAPERVEGIARGLDVGHRLDRRDVDAERRGGGRVGFVADAPGRIQAGAKEVVAIELAPQSIECLRRNLGSEISAGRVVIYPKGVWDKEERIMLNVSDDNFAANSVMMRPEAHITVSRRH